MNITIVNLSEVNIWCPVENKASIDTTALSFLQVIILDYHTGMQCLTPRLFFGDALNMFIIIICWSDV